jgi:citrate synthase
MWTHNITMHTMVHENMKKFMDGFRYDAHPMGMLISTIGALSTFYPEANQIFDAESAAADPPPHRQGADLAAFAYRRGLGCRTSTRTTTSATPATSCDAVRMTERKYKPNPVLERALDVLFILHADHEQNCSTNAMRSVASSQVDPYSAVAAAAAALYGPLHGGANEAVLRMLEEIGNKDNIPAYIKRVKAGRSASWASATGSTRTTTRARRSSRSWPTRSSR